MDSNIVIQIKISQNINHKPSISKNKNMNLQPPTTRIKLSTSKNKNHQPPITRTPSTSKIKTKTFNLEE
jgi:hypothetical protein